MDRCNVDEVQLWLASGIRLLPHMNRRFLVALTDLKYKDKLCLLPQYQLQVYSDRIREAM